jgi:hypothetical protein
MQKKIVRKNLSRSARSLIAMVAPLVSIALNKLIVTCLGSQLLDRKLITTSNMSCTPTNIHRAKVNVAKKDVNASYTYVTKVFSIKVGRISSANTFFDGKTTFGHNL